MSTTQNKQDSESLENKYKDTIDLPQTDFPMRGNGPVREPEFQANWEKAEIYERLLDLRRESGADLFVLHDGPPYLSSDKIHIGTALNKILKDIVIKYKAQRGFITPYIPGYDSHGLPIENAVVKSIKGGRNAVSVAVLREKCKEFALNNLKGQEEKFKRLGVLGDWDNPYVTLQPEFEAEQIRLFAEMAQKGYIYRGLKTVYWSYGCETALADAEVEYNDEHVSNTIYVAFRTKLASIENNENLNNFKHVDLLKEASMVIWTTTPWTMPGNLAITLGEDIDYVIADAKRHKKDGEGKIKETQELGKVVLAKDLLDAFSKDAKCELEVLTETFKGIELKNLITEHPLYDRESPIIFGDHVTTDAGTGAVHTAPGHGQEDFDVGKKFNLGILCPVDGKGVYTREVGTFRNGITADLFKDQDGKLKAAGLGINNIKKEDRSDLVAEEVTSLEGVHVIKHGNDAIINALFKSGALLHKGKVTHSYPYCWRSKTPLLYRATEQWFASVDGFRDEALSEIDKVTWIPERGRNRIYSMVEDRGDWCISRQRTWGVPIPAFYDKSEVDEFGNYRAILDIDLIEYIAKLFEKEGSSIWYEKDPKDLIPAEMHNGTKYHQFKVDNLVKETDTMDVWFDSGSTHRSVVAKRTDLSPRAEGQLDIVKHFRVADLYLEGSDQHRGWFQSSLLTSVATNHKAPYKSVLTHGFVMDEKGRKMSKSLGNVVDPADVIKKYGADILRLWVASVDYSIDIKVGDNMFKQLSDIYRNLRNTSRYMLGSLCDFNPAENTVSYDELWDVDKLILHRLQKLIDEVTVCFDKYQFFKYYQLLQNFCSVDLSAFYFDIIKDRLYTHGTNSKSRRAAQTVLVELLSVINRMFVPVLPHLAEDVYTHIAQPVKKLYQSDKSFGLQSDEADSILFSNWPIAQTKYVDDDLAAKWEKILVVKDEAYKELEAIRKDKLISKFLEAKITINCEKETLELLKSLNTELKAVLMVASIELKEADKLSVKAENFNGVKCVRCWKYFSEAEINDGICSGCTEAVA